MARGGTDDVAAVETGAEFVARVRAFVLPLEHPVTAASDAIVTTHASRRSVVTLLHYAPKPPQSTLIVFLRGRRTA
ncbi:MAG: hypothetical protein JWL83_2312 [Actinomycetia bacterium]|nr:hypothetical protein [Actinomycetes bacterium]